MKYEEYMQVFEICKKHKATVELHIVIKEGRICEKYVGLFNASQKTLNELQKCGYELSLTEGHIKVTKS